MFSFSMYCQFFKDTVAVHIPTAIYERSSFSASLPTLGVISLFNFSYSSVYVVVSHFGFSSQFPDSRGSFSESAIFFCDLPDQSLAHLSICLPAILLFVGALHIF